VGTVVGAGVPGVPFIFFSFSNKLRNNTTHTTTMSTAAELAVIAEAQSAALITGCHAAVVAQLQAAAATGVRSLTYPACSVTCAAVKALLEADGFVVEAPGNILYISF